MKKIIRDKITEIFDKIPLASHLSRKKFMGDFLMGLIASRKVQFQEIAQHIESEAEVSSVERRIQGFFKDFEIDYEKVCLLLLMLLPKGKLHLSIDRTEWDFAVYQCNILMIVAKNGSMLKKLADGDFLFLVGNLPAKQLGNAYRHRWCIEVLFQTFKQRGFDLEATHLKESYKIRKLLVFVSIAVAICAKMGQYIDKKVKPIKVKKHQYKARSFFRTGLDYIRQNLIKQKQEFINTCLELIDKFLRWIDLQFYHNQMIKKIFG